MENGNFFWGLIVAVVPRARVPPEVYVGDAMVWLGR